MNRDAAIQLISQTFDNPFDEKQFGRLASNILNEVDRSKAFVSRHGNYIPQPFRDHIRQYKRPFVYTDPNGERLDVLIVRLHKTSGLERARTMQRNFISWYLKQGHSEAVEAALVAFYHDDAPDWRFSLVRLEYVFGEAGVEEKLTPARRYSYLVGPTEPTHTAEQQLLPFLLNDAVNPTIDDLAGAFQIETVSKQFFEAYKELFLRLTEAIEATLKRDTAVANDFRRAGIHLPSFAKKLLGQIVFLYFIQKKGWLGVEPGKDWGTGPRDFLRQLFQRSQKTPDVDFFNDILEPLFYDALAIQRPDDLFTLKGYTVKIPFLNGGLFEPMGGYDWRHTNLALPNALFSNRKDERDDSATGILDVFDRYNFTVWEEEPLEKEVAVDPEMLGKVFENLLEVQDRKSKGAFYTPREIVHYMCQESLINYLDTTLNCDRATGERNEVVPRQAITKLVRLGSLALQQDAAKEAGLKKDDYVLPEAVRTHAATLDEALADIKLCDPAIGSGAFPVGMLHEIVQARQATSIYLDQTPAPYDLKRHAIQESIYGVDIDGGAVEIAKLRLWLSLVVDEDRYDAIQPLPNLDYKIVQGDSLGKVEKNLFNVALFADLDELKRRYFDETHPREKTKLRAQIDQLIGLLTNGKRDFDFEIYFHEVFEERGGFDVVIGNPPYVRQERLRAIKPQLKANFPQVYAGTADLYVYFYARGIHILRERGTLAYISSNKFMRAGYGKKLRQFLGTQTTLYTTIDFGDLPVFDATAYPTIVITRKRPPASDHNLLALTVESLDVLRNLPLVVHDLAWPVPQKSLRPEGWALVRPQVRALMEKLRRKGMPLADFVNGKFYRGVVTGYNPAFVIDEATRQWLIEEDSRSAEVIKPWLRGKDIKRWRVDWRGLYLLYIPWDFPIQRFPAIRAHLSKYRAKLEARPEVKQGRFPWYALSRYASEYVHEFEKQKIVYPHFNTHPNFALDDNGTLSNDKTYIIPEPPLFLLGLLNSRAAHFALKQLCPAVQQGYMELRTIYVGQIPVPALDTENQERLESLIRGLIAVEGQGPQVAAWEQELNAIVYQLYDLTDEEIALIEESVA